MPVPLSEERRKNLAINNVTMFKALQKPCADCLHYWHPLVMSFDHVDRKGKFKNPSSLRTYDPEVFNAELAKCEVVCLNCHSVREWLRDLGIIEISQGKINKHKYYQRLIPFLEGGAVLNQKAYDFVRVGVM